MNTPNVLELFAGIGGLSLGLERAGFAVVGQVEIDPFCQRVLAKHWPEVPRHDDVCTTVTWWRSRPRPTVDVVAGGFPCQPVSQAGRRLAQQDQRWLWPAMAEVINELRPVWVIAENVPGLHRRGLPDVLRDLDRLGYRTRTGLLSACAVGAPHTRQRLFVLAHTAGLRRCPRWDDPTGVHPTHGQQQNRGPARGSSWWTTEPRLDRVAYGLPDRVDRCRGLGNAVVPHVAEYIGRLIHPSTSHQNGPPREIPA